ncbi:perlucin-like protein isoform X2 [Neocloeon triangulifer]|nr:perlucin-like protein isoform X2 [Neocloeon triangulifer]
MFFLNLIATVLFFQLSISGVKCGQYVTINETLYFLEGSNLANWYEANTECLMNEMTLLSLETRIENENVMNWLNSTEFYNTWIWSGGIRRENENEWNWNKNTDNITMTYTNWGPNQPNVIQSEESCMNFAAEYGKWDDDQCNDYSQAFMCERNNTEVTTEGGTTTTTQGSTEGTPGATTTIPGNTTTTPRPTTTTPGATTTTRATTTTVVAT